jgi:hypothetical protein
VDAADSSTVRTALTWAYARLSCWGTTWAWGSWACATGPVHHVLLSTATTPQGRPTGSRDVRRPSVRTGACRCRRRAATSSPANWPSKAYRVASGMRWSTRHAVKRSTARQRPRFVNNPHHKARLRVGNVHRRPFCCRGSATNRLKAHAGWRQMRRKQCCDRSSHVRSAVVIGPPG